MLKHLLLLTGFVSLFTTVTARAQTGRAASGVQGQTSARVGEELFRSGLDFGFVTGIFNYSEPGMRDSGNLNGFAAAFDRRNEAGLAGRLEGDLMFGILKYDGALNDVANQTSKPYSTQTFDAILNLRALGGYAFDAGSSTEIRPFIGGGYRVLSDNMQGEGAYQREITYYYLPVGLAVTFGTGGGWKVRATAEYDRLLSGTAKSYLTQVNLGKDVENHQSAGEGLRLAVDINGTINERFDLHVVPYYQQWHVQDSDTQFVDKRFGYAYEPENRTELFGLGLSIGI